MAGFEPGDVVRVPFPYTDRPVRQHRPALVVSDGPVGAGNGLLWVLMITSAANPGWPGDVPLHDLEAAGLPAPSLVRTAKIATIDVQTADRLGSVGADALAEVRSQVRRVLERR